MVTPRALDWPKRLMAVVARARTQPFVWGENDCALFTADAIQAMTGVDYAAAVRGKYTTEYGATKTLLAQGYSSLDDYVTDRFGEPLPSVLAAARGDIVQVKTDGGLSLAICLGTHAAVVGGGGVIFLDASYWRKAWRV